MSKRSSLIGFALAGLAAGAAAWYLFGTKEGRETLDRAMAGMQDFSDQVKTRAKEGMEYASDVVDKTKRKAGEAYEKAETNIKAQAQKAKAHGKSMARDVEDLGKQAASKARDMGDEAEAKSKKYT